MFLSSRPSLGAEFDRIETGAIWEDKRFGIN